jgi:hypothetical protein
MNGRFAVRIDRIALSLALALAGKASAIAAPLSIVEVGAPAVNCVFAADCILHVNDSTGAVAMPFLATPGTVWLQSRTFTGAAGTPGGGKTGYLYRLSMTQAAGSGECLVGLVLNFGPVVKLPYKAGTMADVFVITAGGLGTVKLKSAEQDGNVITFEFEKPMCVPPTPSDSATTFFFGMASSQTPTFMPAIIYGYGSPPTYEVDARAPLH